jgi:hypothetical protein
MAVKSQSFLVRVFFVMSLLFNVIFVLRSFSGHTTVQSRAQRFHHRAVAVKEETDAGVEPLPESLTKSTPHQIPNSDASQEPATASTRQFETPPTFAKPSIEDTRTSSPAVNIRIGQFSQVSQIKLEDDFWTVIEDLSQRDGDLIFESTKTKERRVFPKTAEAAFYEYDARWPKFAGLRLSQIGLSAPDLLAEQML